MHLDILSQELNIHFDRLKVKKNLIKKHIFNNLVCGKFSEDKNLKIFYFLYFNDHDILELLQERYFWFDLTNWFQRKN
jgi:hypothetical protein